MKNRWSDKEMESFVKSCGATVPPEFARQVFATRLLGGEPDLALHGGGNTSIKTNTADFAGDLRPALFVKASGCAMENADRCDFIALDLDKLNKLRKKRS